MRDLIEVIDRIIKVAPDLEPYFKSLKESIPYSSPEVIPYRWSEAAKILNKNALNHPQQKEIGDIFAARK